MSLRCLPSCYLYILISSHSSSGLCCSSHQSSSRSLKKEYAVFRVFPLAIPSTWISHPPNISTAPFLISLRSVPMPFSQRTLPWLPYLKYNCSAFLTINPPCSLLIVPSHVSSSIYNLLDYHAYCFSSISSTLYVTPHWNVNSLRSWVLMNMFIFLLFLQVPISVPGTKESRHEETISLTVAIRGGLRISLPLTLKIMVGQGHN